jgi:asparagine synthase (glutamine-hydrolysing)
MCGIAGRVSLRPRVDRAALRRAAALLRHRGPDADGEFVAPGVGLVHTRLAIVDLAGGAQPMHNEDGAVTVVFNGEVYNHAELRRELEPRGHVFRTRSDTEAIVHGFEEWDLGLPARLRGMFGIAIWDQKTQRLVLIRDRVGIKPIYYAELRGGDLAFASDVRALLGWPDVPRDIDDDAVAQYLALRYVPAPATTLRAVRKLPPGSILTWHKGAIRVEPFWDLPLADPARSLSPREALAELSALVDESVRLRLMADVPLGVFLSGGVDSSVVTAAMARHAGGRVQSFAVGFNGPDCELEAARIAASAIGTEHHEIKLDPDEVMGELPTLVRRLDEPVADSAAVPLYFLARAARQHVKVVLSGEGGDEAFAGYITYPRNLAAERVHRALAQLWLDRAAAELIPAAASRLSAHPRIARGLRMAALPLDERYIGVTRALDSHREHAVRALAPLWARTPALSPLRRMLYVDTKVWLPDDLLVKADKMTMAHALELRVPLLDHRLLEWAWRLPDRFLDRKRLLRRLAARSVPRALVERKKRGFPNPIGDWLRGPIRGLAHEVCTSSRAMCPLGKAETLRLLEAHRKFGAFAGEVWTLVVLELWRREVPGAPLPREIHFPREAIA